MQPPTAPPPPSLELLKSLLSSTLRITVADTRVFLGMFVATDKALNVILVNADEFRAGSPAGRYVGQIMVPWRLVRRVEVQEAEPADGDVDGDADLYM